MSADLVNSLFEFCGAALSLLSVRALVRDKQVNGVSALPVLFFTSWGGWNCYFCPSLGCWWSFGGGVALLAVNVVWLSLLLTYQLKLVCPHRWIPMFTDRDSPQSYVNGKYRGYRVVGRRCDLCARKEITK